MGVLNKDRSQSSTPSQEVEPELLLSKNLLVSRLEETTSKFQEVDLESYSSSEKLHQDLVVRYLGKLG